MDEPERVPGGADGRLSDRAGDRAAEPGGTVLTDHDDQAARPDQRYLASVKTPGPYGLTPNEKRTARRLIAKFCLLSEQNRGKIHYTQNRPFDVSVWPDTGFRGDCSSYVTQAFWYAADIMDGVPLHDPSGNVEYDGFGFCHEPDARILTADLRWVAAGDVVTGQEVWSLDESPIGGRKGRGYRKGFVLASFPAKKECVRVCLVSGDSFVCTTDHPWLSYTVGQRMHRWRRADKLFHFNTDGCFLVRPFIPWAAETSYEAGWLAGMFDGEGWLQNRSARGGRTSVLGVTQVLGPTADRIVETGSRYGDFSVSTIEREGVQTRIDMVSNGCGVTGIASFLGRIRPERLITNFNIEGGEVQTKHESRVARVEKVGLREIQAIETSTGTYFAEGFAVHNTGTLLATNHKHRIPVSHKFFIGDLAIYGTFYDTHHVTMCRKGGLEPASVWSSHGSESGPKPEGLHYRSDLLGVYRPVSLL